MVEAILKGQQPERMTLPKLMEGVAVEWGPYRVLGGY
jgi:hypothetical protein